MSNKSNWFKFKSVELTPQAVKVNQTVKIEVAIAYEPVKEYSYVYPYRYRNLESKKEDKKATEKKYSYLYPYKYVD